MIDDIKSTRWTAEDLRIMFIWANVKTWCVCVCVLGWLKTEYCLTLRFFKLPGLVGDGLGDFAEWGVDSWLAGVPFTTRGKRKMLEFTKKKNREKKKEKCTKFVNETQQIFQAPQESASALILKKWDLKILSVNKKRRNHPHSCSCFPHSHP